MLAAQTHFCKIVTEYIFDGFAKPDVAKHSGILSVPIGDNSIPDIPGEFFLRPPGFNFSLALFPYQTKSPGHTGSIIFYDRGKTPSGIPYLSGKDQIWPPRFQ